MTLFIFLVYAAGAVALAFLRSSLRHAAIGSAALLLVYLILGGDSLILGLILLLSAAVTTLLSLDRVRINHITPVLLRWYRRSLPGISETEREAIDAGSVWWEGELFGGAPDWRRLLDEPKTQLTEEEQAFLDGPVEELCRRVDSWDVNFNLADVPGDLIPFIKENGFLGLIIPKDYGGLGFSPLAQVMIMTRLFSLSGVVANYINIPNALGPGELLLEYGTQEQKDYYLPRLARGEELPCFALTSPFAGSDATSLPDTGTVCKGLWQGREIIGMRLDIDKRYITLAPVATLIGLAFRLRDPDHLIGDVDDYGLTCALIPHDVKGIEIGRRHLPIGDPFVNGPIRGRGVFVPLDTIIGGVAMAGTGWRMLLNCLSAGRAISLPCTANSFAQNALAATGVYTRIRRQFNLPIARFEGVQKPLAAMAGLTCIINAAGIQTAKALNRGQKPAVAGSILKYHSTEMARQVVNHAMDIHGGKGVMKGPGNYLSDRYESVPVPITVEGANIMTRSLMIFGQGAIRCHPFILREMQLTQAQEDEAVIREFDRVFFRHLGNTCRNGAHALVHALTGSLFAPAPADTDLRDLYRQASRLSAAFAFVADMALASLRGSLKMREMLSARLGDLLSTLYLISMLLKHHDDQGRPAEDRPLVRWGCRYLMHQYQEAMHELLRNLPNRPLALICRAVVFPLGRRFHAPEDALDSQVALLVTQPTETRRRLIEGIYLTPNDNNPVGRLNALLPEVDAVDPLYVKLRQAVKEGLSPTTLGADAITVAQQAGIINAEEATALRDYDEKAMAFINVDEFEYGDLGRRTSAGTQIRKKPGRKKAVKKNRETGGETENQLQDKE
ncbi:MAG: acyl-CoA dehydrogenase [Gammaproteobacteria bacterium]